MSRVQKLSLTALAAALAACGGSTTTAPEPATTAAAPAGETPPTSESTAEVEKAPASPGMRLPDTVVPKRYAAELDLDSTTTDLAGRVAIDVEIKQPTDVVWLNGKGLVVTKAEVTASGQTFAGRPVVVDADEMLGLVFDAPLPAGPAQVVVEYTGTVADNEVFGVFRQKEGDNHYIYTQFEAVAARRGFPSFDEPMFKTPWQLTLRVPEDQQAFSNTPVANESVADGKKTVVFAETKPIPSYLVAFAVGPFEVVDAGTGGRNKTPLRIIVPKGRTDQASFAVEVTGDLLTRLENYFDRAYPYEKLDSIAIPSFFGAMENPGLITYAQNIILAKKEDESLSFKRGYVGTGAHEIAHQWFGNLVTMKWWDDLWLNESFTTWISAKIVAEYRPEWNAQVRSVGTKETAMGSDSTETAKPIRQPIKSLADIFGGGSGIIYAKGKTVIAMFESWIGEDKFREGIRQYINDHAWGNADTNDFLAALTRASSPELADAFTSFITQPGVPLVSVELDCQRGQAPKVKLAQERFFTAGQQARGGAQTWQIPVCMRYGNRKSAARQCELFTAQTAEVELSQAKRCPDWLIANDGSAGYYRVDYKGKLLDQNLFGAGQRQLTEAERVGTIGNMSALVNAGKFSAGDAFTKVPRLLRDKSTFVATSTVTVVSSVDANLVSDDLRPNYQRFIRKMYSKRVRSLGWEAKKGEDQEVTRLRPVILGLMAKQGGDDKLRQQAVAKARAWLEDPSSVAPEMLGAVLGIAGLANDADLYEAILEQAKNTEDVRKRSRLLAALGSFTDKALVERNLSLVLTDTFELREAFGLMFAPLANPETRDLAYAFAKANVDKLMEKLPALYQPFVVYMASTRCTQEGYDDAKAFFEPKVGKLMGGQNALQQTLAGIKSCIAIKEAQQPSVSKFLRKY